MYTKNFLTMCGGPLLFAILVASCANSTNGNIETPQPSGTSVTDSRDDVERAQREDEERARVEEQRREEAEQERIGELLTRTDTLAAMYDYDAALELLKPETSPQALVQRALIEAQRAKAVPWPYPDRVPHLFFHSLIVDTDRAFDGDANTQGYLDYMVTKREFEAILQQLYDRGYVLVAPHDIATIQDGEMTYRDIVLPEGKQPLVISEDDVSYYEYMAGDGFADRLVVDTDGSVVSEYTDAQGTTVRGQYDLPPIVDSFVAEHPDFSYRGAKGILALTGYNGVFGYRTSGREYPDSTTLASDIAAATEVADALKASGWVFASHAWGHLNVTNASMERLERDSRWWDEEVRPILGDTDQYIYPFGADISDVKKYRGAKFDLLSSHGFSYFYGVDGTTFSWMQQGKTYQRQARINVDGLQFAKEKRGDRQVLKDFMDVDSVIDPARVAYLSR